MSTATQYVGSEWWSAAIGGAIQAGRDFRFVFVAVYTFNGLLLSPPVRLPDGWSGHGKVFCL